MQPSAESSVPPSSAGADRRKDDLHTEGIEKLSAPGLGSNWLDWAFLMEASINASIYAYVMAGPIPKPPPPHYESDKAKLCGVFARYVLAPNLVILRKHRNDPRAMWSALKAAHKVNSAGNRIYWLERLVSFRFQTEDIASELQRLESVAERLGSLITPSKPLTVDEILSMFLATTLPPSFKPVITPLLQRSEITLSEVIAAVREEITRSSISVSHFHTFPADDSVAKTSTNSNSASRSYRPDPDITTSSKSKAISCNYCKRKGHLERKCRTKLSDDVRRMKEEMDQMRLKSNRSKRRDEEEAKRTKDDANVSDSSATIDFPDYSPSERSSAALSPDGARANSGSSIVWGLDTMCTQHMAPPAVDLKLIKPSSVRVHLADDTVIPSSALGEIVLPLGDGLRQNVLRVPKLHEPLLSVACLTENHLSLEFGKHGCTIRDASSGAVVGNGFRCGNLYYLRGSAKLKSPSPSSSNTNRVSRVSDTSLLVWHRRLGHLGLAMLKTQLKKWGIKYSCNGERAVLECPVCFQSKLSRRSFQSRSPYRANRPLQIIHSDVAEMPVPSKEGHRYYVLFLDDYSKYVCAVAMKRKSEVFSHFKSFHARFERMLGKKIVEIRSDNGGEYNSTDFVTYCTSQGITMTMGPPRTPQLNGVAERWNRKAGNRIRCLFNESKLPHSFWPDALKNAVQNYNISPTRTSFGFSPPEDLFTRGSIRSDDLKPSGCGVWFLNRPPLSDKFTPRALKGVFLHYLEGNKGWVVWDLANKKRVKTTSGSFLEDSFPGISSTSPVLSTMPWPDLDATRAPDWPPAPTPSTPSLPPAAPATTGSPPPAMTQIPSPAIPPRRSGRATRPPQRLGDGQVWFFRTRKNRIPKHTRRCWLRKKSLNGGQPWRTSSGRLWVSVPGTLCLGRPVVKLYIPNGFSEPNGMPIAPSVDSKQDSWPWVSPRSRVLTTMKFSHRPLVRNLSICCSRLWPPTTGSLNRWTLRPPSLTATSKRRYLCRNQRDLRIPITPIGYAGSSGPSTDSSNPLAPGMLSSTPFSFRPASSNQHMILRCTSVWNPSP